MVLRSTGTTATCSCLNIKKKKKKTTKKQTTGTVFPTNSAEANPSKLSRGFVQAS